MDWACLLRRWKCRGRNALFWKDSLRTKNRINYDAVVVHTLLNYDEPLQDDIIIIILHSLLNKIPTHSVSKIAFILLPCQRQICINLNIPEWHLRFQIACQSSTRRETCCRVLSASSPLADSLYPSFRQISLPSSLWTWCSSSSRFPESELNASHIGILDRLMAVSFGGWLLKMKHGRRIGEATPTHAFFGRDWDLLGMRVAWRGIILGALESGIWSCMAWERNSPTNAFFGGIDWTALWMVRRVSNGRWSPLS